MKDVDNQSPGHSGVLSLLWSPSSFDLHRALSPATKGPVLLDGAPDKMRCLLPVRMRPRPHSPSASWEGVCVNGRVIGLWLLSFSLAQIKAWSADLWCLSVNYGGIKGIYEGKEIAR